MRNYYLMTWREYLVTAALFFCIGAAAGALACALIYKFFIL